MTDFFRRHRTIVVGAAITAAVPVLNALSQFDPEAIADWRLWAVGIGAASVRQVAVFLTRQVSSGFNSEYAERIEREDLSAYPPAIEYERVG